MRIALPIWNGRVSPLFDSSRQALVVDVDAGQTLERTETVFGPTSAPEKVARLASLSVNVLICGAISRPVAALVETAGIRLVGWTAGDAEEVLNAYVDGRLEQECFFMPGCRRRGRRRRGGRCPVWSRENRRS